MKKPKLVIGSGFVEGKKAAKMRWDEALPVLQEAKKITGHVPRGNNKREEPVVLSAEEWFAIAFAVADYNDSSNTNQQLRNTALEKIGVLGELAHRCGTRGERG